MSSGAGGVRGGGRRGGWSGVVGAGFPRRRSGEGHPPQRVTSIVGS